MQKTQNWLHKHLFEVYVAAFLLMLLPGIPLYSEAGKNNTPLILLLLCPIIAGNLLVLLIQ